MDQVSIEALLGPAYVRAIDEGRYHDALAIVFAAYLAARGEQDSGIEKGLLALLRTTIDLKLHKEHQVDDTTCSFCRTKAVSDQRIGGLNAIICRSCSMIIHGYFCYK